MGELGWSVKPVPLAEWVRIPPFPLNCKYVVMASENKKRKLKNAYAVGGLLKNKGPRLKRLQFFTASERQELKRNVN